MISLKKQVWMTSLDEKQQNVYIENGLSFEVKFVFCFLLELSLSQTSENLFAVYPIDLNLPILTLKCFPMHFSGTHKDFLTNVQYFNPSLTYSIFDTKNNRTIAAGNA